MKEEEARRWRRIDEEEDTAFDAHVEHDKLWPHSDILDMGTVERGRSSVGRHHSESLSPRFRPSSASSSLPPCYSLVTIIVLLRAKVFSSLLKGKCPCSRRREGGRFIV